MTSFGTHLYVEDVKKGVGNYFQLYVRPFVHSTDGFGEISIVDDGSEGLPVAVLVTQRDYFDLCRILGPTDSNLRCTMIPIPADVSGTPKDSLDAVIRRAPKIWVRNIIACSVSGPNRDHYNLTVSFKSKAEAARIPMWQRSKLVKQLLRPAQKFGLFTNDNTSVVMVTQPQVQRLLYLSGGGMPVDLNDRYFALAGNYSVSNLQRALMSVLAS